MRVALVILLVVAHHAAAEAKCKRGKVIYREVQAPIPGHDAEVPNGTFELSAGGTWNWVEEMPEGEDPASHGGCLTKAQLREVVRAIAHAKFAQGSPDMCDAVTERLVTVSAPRRKKSAHVSDPCGDTVDATTQALMACVARARVGGGKALKAICRGQE